MNPPIEPRLTQVTPNYLSGEYLYIAGSDLFNPLNQPSQHLPFHLAKHLEHLDLVGYVRFYDAAPAPAWQRLKHGISNVLFHRINIKEEENIRTISVRRLRLPGFLDPLIQDLWLYMVFRPYLKKQYLVGIVDGPESAHIAQFLKKTGRVKFLIYYDIDFYPGVQPQWAGILSRREKICCKIADAVASVSRPLAELRTQQGARKAVVIPNGVNFDRFYQANLARTHHPPTLLYVGSLDERWGIDLPLRAMPLLRSQIPELQLLIAGRGPAENNLHQMVESMGLTNCVHFMGFLPYSDIPGFLAQGDIGIATSRSNAFRKYASPLKIVEYMAAGLPVICSGGGEAEIMINDSRGGVHIAFEAQAFADAVLSLFKTPDYLSATRKAALHYARSRSWDQMGLMMAQLISQVSGDVNESPSIPHQIEDKGK